MSAVIEARGITTVLGGQRIHRGLDLVVERGELLALVGGSGSGKTALLRQLVGLTRPASGTVRLFGVELARARRLERRALLRRLGMLFQNGALFSALTAFDNVALPLRELRMLPEDLIGDLVMLKLALVELEPEHAGRLPAELSGGMVKRVALARAMALDPELLILDEPTAGLDPDRSRAFVRLVRRLSRERGLTVLMVTHDVETLSELATHVAVLAEQRIIAHVPLADVAGLDHPFVRGFFGERPDLLHSRGQQQ
ncbi:MAG TPA: ATP-binding cassette domain-containing protein [Burkholderiales bacterium]|jgi:phospholipid/cholesterol/gamma-HCH transport system ATP-binding protein|nr:ATP-binding cassette domain-containing protein [Burkholderiales bacterium]